MSRDEKFARLIAELRTETQVLRTAVEALAIEAVALETSLRVAESFIPSFSLDAYRVATCPVARSAA